MAVVVSSYAMGVAEGAYNKERSGLVVMIMRLNSLRLGGLRESCSSNCQHHPRRVPVKVDGLD